MHVQRQIDQLLAQRAAEWIETLKSGDERDCAAFDQWLRQSKLHVEQYLEMVAIDHSLQRLDPAQGEDAATLLKKLAACNPAVTTLNARLKSEPTTSLPGRNIFKLKIGMAASLVLGSLVLFLNVSRLQQDYVTAVGEQRTVTLSDGSVIAMNVASTIRVDFSSTARDVDLKNGEAVFKVAHDAARPFVVHTKSADVRAIGTQFNVYERPEGTIVSVLEGRVQIAPKGKGLAAEELTSGEEAQVAGGGQIEKRTHPDTNKAVAWRQRQLVFEETPLEEMVREFNRYGQSVRIKLEDIEPGSHRYGGIFDADDPDSLADLLSREPDLSVEKRHGEIIVRPRTASGSH